MLKPEHYTKRTSIPVAHESLLSQLHLVGHTEQLQLLCQFQAGSMFPVTSTLNPEGTVSSLPLPAIQSFPRKDGLAELILG